MDTNWQPISTAPKGTMEKPIEIVGLNIHTHECAVVSWCEADEENDLYEGWFNSLDEQNEHEPTHWMPLPGSDAPAPSAQASDATVTIRDADTELACQIGSYLGVTLTPQGMFELASKLARHVAARSGKIAEHAIELQKGLKDEPYDRGFHDGVQSMWLKARAALGDSE